MSKDLKLGITIKGALDRSYTHALGSAGRSLDQTGESVRGLGREYTRLEQRMSRKSAAAARLGELKGHILGVAGAVYAAARMIRGAAAFEEAEVRLSTVLNTDDLGRDMAAARRHALDFSRRNIATETEMLTIQYALSSAGMDAAMSRAGSEIVSKVAKVTGGAAEGVGEVVATVFNNLGAGLEGEASERLERIGELLTKTQFKFQIRDFGQLGESMKMATPALSQFNVALDQGLTLVGALNSAGMQGSMAGTALSATFRQLSKASKEFGFEIARDATGGLDFIRTMENLSEAIGGFDELDQDTIDQLQQAFGDEGMRGVVLLGKQLGGLRDAQRDVAESSRGLIDKSYQGFLASTSGQMALLGNNVRILGLTFASTLLPSVNAVLKPLAATAGWVGAMIERFPWAGRLIGGAAAGLGIFVGALVAVTAATWLWNAALLANPIGLTVAAIGGAAAMIITFWDPIAGFFMGLWKTIKALFKEGVGFLTGIWEQSPLGLLFKAGSKLASLGGTALGAVFGDGGGAALAMAGGGLVPEPALAAGPRGGVTATVNAPITINTHPGMDERAVAEEVDRKLRERERESEARARGVLHD